MFYPLNYRCWRPMIKLGGAHHPNAFWNEVGVDSLDSLTFPRVAIRKNAGPRWKFSRVSAPDGI